MSYKSYYFCDIHVGDRICLRSQYWNKTVGGSSLSFETEAVKGSDRFILANEVKGSIIKTKQKGVVNFESSIVKTDMLLKLDSDKTVVWSNVSAKRVTVRGKRYYLISSDFLEGKVVNKREYFRVVVESNAIAQFGAGRKAVDVILRDASRSGFALVVSPEDELHVGSDVTVSSTITGTTILDTFALKLDGVCVRMQKLSENKVLYGFVLTRDCLALKNFIMYKQRESLKRGIGRRW